MLWCDAGMALRAAVLVLCAAGAGAALAEAKGKGKASGLDLPRYVSLKSDHVNLREGPSKEHRTAWVFQRAGLPVEVTAEAETWYRIRDSEGAEGWVLHSLLSGRRTALVAPWKKGEEFPLFSAARDSSEVVAKLQSGVIANLASCDGTWCRVRGPGFDGWIQQTNLWGVYPEDKL